MQTKMYIDFIVQIRPADSQTGAGSGSGNGSRGLDLGIGIGIGIAVEVVYGRKFVEGDIIAFLRRRVKSSQQEVGGWREGVGELKGALLRGEIMVDS